MSLHEWPHILKRLKKGSPLLGLDLGTKTIGVAISDPEWKQASPLLTLKRKKIPADLASLAGLAGERGARGFVIGLPLNMDGSEGPMAEMIRAFVKLMLAHQSLFSGEPEIALFDERLSSAVVERFLIQSDVSRARRKEVVDKLAAQAILQAALDQWQNQQKAS
ncbi:MAG: Holliday junction resolvase RuvX [Proteobacteria bacterium]|nr:Holliday junction resolvase RuvX [Pseudomonadota bacterium]